MPEKLFDNFMRSKLKNYASPVPEGLWEKIVSDKDRKPKVFWWNNRLGLVAIALLVLTTGGIFIANNYYNQHNITFNNSTLQNNNTTSIQNNTAAQSNSSTAITSPSAIAESDTEINKATAATSSRKKDLSNISTGFVTKHNGKNLLSFLQKKNADQSTDFVSVNKEESELNTPVNETESTTAANYKNQKGELMLASRNIYSLTNQHNPPLNLRSILGLGNDCPSANGTQRNDWYLELYGSPDYTMKSLSGNGLSSAYLQKKDSAEKMAGGFTVGARIAKNVGDHFILKAGVQYSQLNEKFSLRTESERRTTVVIVTRTIIRPQGDTTFNDTTTVTQIGYSVRKNVNSYKNIEIPIGVGYEFGDVKDKWKLAVNGGVILNVTSWYTGETLDTSYNIVSVSSKGNNGFYTKKTGLSLYGSVSLIHNINDKLDVFAEPYFRVGLVGMTSNMGFSQKFNAAGLTLGVRMKLNKKQHL
jgi:hypothetical protein